MERRFDKEFWESHWHGASDRDHDRGLPANPYLARELGHLDPGSALDAGCGEGVEAIWLAQNGWDVTAVDISAVALDRACRRASDGRRSAAIEWVEADLSVWQPGRHFDLVTTHYAHPTMPQLRFYQRIAEWVAPGGTLLIVAHLHRPDHGSVDHQPLEEVSVTAEAITAVLDPAAWDVVTADERSRSLRAGSGHTVELHDVVVRSARRV